MSRIRVGSRIRSLRRREGLTQAAMAQRLGISASYLNLIEHDKRPVSANLLIKLAQHFDLDLKSLDTGSGAGLIADLREVFGDPVFDERAVTNRAIEDLVAGNPELARAVVHLFHAYSTARGSAEALAERVLHRQDVADVDTSRIASEQVSDLLQHHVNHFPELEASAEQVWRDAKLEGKDLFFEMAHHLEQAHDVRVRILEVGDMGGAVRRFDPARRELLLSEVLRRGSRNFQLAHQIGLLECSEILDRIVDDPILTSADSRALGRIALANYFAAAILMPYEDFLAAAQQERYDIDLLGHRFRASFEQVCQRLTSLRRRGAEGVPFYMVRVDIAGNISKRFSPIERLRFPRFSGLCPLWSVHAAFAQPGRIRVQLCQLPDHTVFFAIARTVRKHQGGYHAPSVLHTIGLGCDVESARHLVYADGVDLGHVESAAPLGMTCRLCDRTSCEARAFPSLQTPLQVDENQRGVSFYTPVGEPPRRR